MCTYRWGPSSRFCFICSTIRVDLHRFFSSLSLSSLPKGERPCESCARFLPLFSTIMDISLRLFCAKVPSPSQNSRSFPRRVLLSLFLCSLFPFLVSSFPSFLLLSYVTHSADRRVARRDSIFTKRIAVPSRVLYPPPLRIFWLLFASHARALVILTPDTVLSRFVPVNTSHFRPLFVRPDDSCHGPSIIISRSFAETHRRCHSAVHRNTTFHAARARTTVCDSTIS